MTGLVYYNIRRKEGNPKKGKRKEKKMATISIIISIIVILFNITLLVRITPWGTSEVIDKANHWMDRIDNRINDLRWKMHR